ncbi:TlpA family protein disulfide reductase [Deminuibacter soli]|nr:redoxin domain-containing protein [Deminuibacter soli]
MKKAALVILLLAGFFTVHAQRDISYDTTAPYRHHPAIPDFKLLQPDSTWFNSADLPKNKHVVIVYFNPDCGHCQQEAKSMIEHKSELTNGAFVFVSYHNPQQIGEFVKEYKLKELAYVVAGRDTQYYIPSFFRIKFTPFVAVYDKKGNLQKTFEGGAEIDALKKELSL